MAALTANSWTVTVRKRTLNASSQKRETYGVITLAGTDTYPTNGIPLPDKGKFGMVRELDQLTFIGVSGEGGGGGDQYMTNYYKEDYTMVFYEEEDTAAGGPLPEAGTDEVPGPRSWDFIARGW